MDQSSSHEQHERRQRLLESLRFEQLIFVNQLSRPRMLKHADGFLAILTTKHGLMMNS
jgi:hypothetical protein